jgi:hypothetical protein
MISDNTALYAEARYDAHFKDAGDDLLYLGGQSAVAGLKIGF